MYESEGKVEFTATVAGTHQICFDNTMSRWTAKVVTFKVTGGSGAASAGSGAKKDDLVKFEHLTPMVDSVIKVSEELVLIEGLQRHMRVREQQHRDSAEATNSRVQWMSIVESILLVSISVLQ